MNTHWYTAELLVADRRREREVDAYRWRLGRLARRARTHEQVTEPAPTARLTSPQPRDARRPAA